MKNDRLLQAARGKTLDCLPVWMVRPAGRYLKAYRDLCQKYLSFRDRLLNTVLQAGTGHILNLGHGVLPNTPEENVAFFFETVKQLSYSSSIPGCLKQPSFA